MLCIGFIFECKKVKRLTEYILINNGRPTHLNTLVIYKYHLYCKKIAFILRLRRLFNVFSSDAYITKKDALESIFLSVWKVVINYFNISFASHISVANACFFSLKVIPWVLYIRFKLLRSIP